VPTIVVRGRRLGKLGREEGKREGEEKGRENPTGHSRA